MMRRVYGVNGTFVVVHEPDPLEEFDYVSVEQFQEMSDYQRTRYISDLRLYEMRYGYPH